MACATRPRVGVGEGGPYAGAGASDAVWYVAGRRAHSAGARSRRGVLPGLVGGPEAGPLTGRRAVWSRGPLVSACRSRRS